MGRLLRVEHREGAKHLPGPWGQGVSSTDMIPAYVPVYKAPFGPIAIAG